MDTVHKSMMDYLAGKNNIVDHWFVGVGIGTQPQGRSDGILHVC
jgi:hypothetical protein